MSSDVDMWNKQALSPADVGRAETITPPISTETTVLSYSDLQLSTVMLTEAYSVGLVVTEIAPVSKVT